MHNGETIERVHTKKIFGNHFDENLSWSYHVNCIIQSSYTTLWSLCQFKHLSLYKVGKSLAEALIISKIRYYLVIYSQLLKYQIQRLQKTQNRVASYVLGPSVKEDNLIKTFWIGYLSLNWWTFLLQSAISQPYTTQPCKNTCL